MKVELEKRILPSAKEVIIVHNPLKLVDVLIFLGGGHLPNLSLPSPEPKEKVTDTSTGPNRKWDCSTSQFPRIHTSG